VIGQKNFNTAHETRSTRYRDHKIPSTETALSRLTSIHKFALDFINIRFNIILPSKSITLYNHFRVTFQDQNFLATLILVTHATNPTHQTLPDFITCGDKDKLDSYSKHGFLHSTFTFSSSDTHVIIYSQIFRFVIYALSLDMNVFEGLYVTIRTGKSFIYIKVFWHVTPYNVVSLSLSSRYRPGVAQSVPGS
jgi:hypothetical protein